MIRAIIHMFRLGLSRSKLVREHCAAVAAYDAAKRRGDTRGQHDAFDRLRAATNARLEARV